MKIEIKNLSKDFGDGPLFHDFSASFLPGNVYVIHGVSGCGKSTLLSLIGLIDRPTTGSIHFDGSELANGADAERNAFRRDNISFFFQGNNLFQDLTIEKNLLCVTEAGDQIDLLLTRFGLSHLKNKKAKNCSRGESQRAGICRVFLEDKPIILLDEPTASLDFKNRTTFYKSLEEFKENKIIFIVSHKYKTDDPAPFIHHLNFENGVIELDDATIATNVKSSENEKARTVPNFKKLRGDLRVQQIKKSVRFSILSLFCSSFFGFVSGSSASYITKTPNHEKTALCNLIGAKTIAYDETATPYVGTNYRLLYSLNETHDTINVFCTNDPAIPSNGKNGCVAVTEELAAKLTNKKIEILGSEYPIEIIEDTPIIPTIKDYAVISEDLLKAIDPKSDTFFNESTLGELPTDLPSFSSPSIYCLERKNPLPDLPSGEIAISLSKDDFTEREAKAIEEKIAGKSYSTTITETQEWSMGVLFSSFKVSKIILENRVSTTIGIRLSAYDAERISDHLLHYFPFEGKREVYRSIADIPVSDLSIEKISKTASSDCRGSLAAFQNYSEAYSKIILPIFVISALFSTMFSILFLISILKASNREILLSEAIGLKTTICFVRAVAISGLSFGIPFLVSASVSFLNNPFLGLSTYGASILQFAGTPSYPWLILAIVSSLLAINVFLAYRQGKMASSNLSSAIKISKEYEDEGI